MSTLLHYLAALATDPAAQHAFGQDPEAALAASGLSEPDKAVLRTRNAGLIQATVGQQAVAAMVYGSGAPQAQMVYGSGPPPSPMVYGAGAPPPTVAIYIVLGAPLASPPMVYGVGGGVGAHPAMVYGAHPAMVYGATAQPAMVYSATPPAMVYGAGEPTK